MRNELGQFVKGHTVKESWRKSLSERLKENNPGFKKEKPPGTRVENSQKNIK